MRLTGAKTCVYSRTIFNNYGDGSVQSTIETSDGPLAYRVAQFCKSIGLGKTKFYELVRDGKIKTIVIGGRRLIPADEAQRLVREGCE
jgi:excisionase family DNA binding protein